jgi:predicted DNA-binding transcriptional regulator AlpA
MTNAAAQSELPKYVGYAEIAAATGMDKRQIQRLMARGKFPKPDGIPTKENRWRLSVILEWLVARNAEQMATISDLAVTDPAKLKPEQLEEALSGAAAELARRAGIDLPPGSHVSVNVPLSDEQQAALQRSAVEARDAAANALFAAFEQLGEGRAMLVAAGLMPSMLTIMRHLCGDHADALLGGSDAERRAQALAILGQVMDGLLAKPSAAAE